MISFAPYKLHEFRLLWSEGKDSDLPVQSGECPQKPHQHMLLNFTVENKPNTTLILVQDPDSQEWHVCEEETAMSNAQNLMGFMQEVAQGLGLDAQFVAASPEEMQLPPSNDSKTDIPTGMYL